MCNRRIPLLIFLLIVNLIGCQRKEAVEPLRLAQTENLYSLDPDRAADAQSRAILSNLYEALVEFDGDLKIHPALATNWNTPDELTWIFEIRKGVKFHDGSTLTASDVKLSLIRVGGPDIHDPVLGISGIDVIDNYHVRLRLSHPSPLLLNRLTQILIVSKAQAGITIERPIGTGPYRFVRRTNKGLQLAAFDQHWRIKPSIRRVSFSPLRARMISDRFEQRNLDVYRLLPTRMPEPRPRSMRVLGRSGLALLYLWFNCAPELEGKKNPFGDVRVRQAISLALDRNRIVKTLGGFHTPAEQLIPEGVLGFIPSWEKLLHDPPSSRRLLAEAGYPDGFETSLTHPCGESYDQLVRIIAEMLAPVGIRVRPKELEFAKLLEARGNQELPFFVLPWTFDDGDAWAFLRASLHSKAGPQDFRSTNAGYSNPVVDRFIQESQQASDAQNVSIRYQAILKIAMSEFPVVPLFRRYDLYGISDRVRFRPRLDGKLLAAEMELIN